MIDYLKQISQEFEVFYCVVWLRNRKIVVLRTGIKETKN